MLHQNHLIEEKLFVLFFLFFEFLHFFFQFLIVFDIIFLQFLDDYLLLPIVNLSIYYHLVLIFLIIHHLLLYLIMPYLLFYMSRKNGLLFFSFYLLLNLYLRHLNHLCFQLFFFYPFFFIILELVIVLLIIFNYKSWYFINFFFNV